MAFMITILPCSFFSFLHRLAFYTMGFTKGSSLLHGNPRNYRISQIQTFQNPIQPSKSRLLKLYDP